MSRIGKQPVVIPSGVQLKFDGNVVTAKGPKGELKEALHPYVKAEVKGQEVILTSDITVARDASAIW
ncbi:MAG: 50S ribosomal protein L6, partial [Elusimicrobia bacterium]|nr:50S ribosomal protein L6 [Elusimicrobiota bacterium]